MGQRCGELRVRRCQGADAARVALGERGSDAPPAPGAGKVEPVEMHNARVAAIAHLHRDEQGRRLAAIEARQEAREPGTEACRRQHLPHELRFDQRGREKILARGLPCRGIVGIIFEPASRPRLDCRAKLVMLDQARPFHREHETEGRVGMHPMPDGKRRLRQPCEVAVRERAGEWHELTRPRLRIGIVPSGELGGELHQPGPAIGTLE